MKKKFLSLIIGVGLMGASSFAVFASGGTNSSASNDSNKTKSCCTQNAQCCIQKAACCK